MSVLEASSRPITAVAWASNTSTCPSHFSLVTMTTAQCCVLYSHVCLTGVVCVCVFVCLCVCVCVDQSNWRWRFSKLQQRFWTQVRILPVLQQSENTHSQLSLAFICIISLSPLYLFFFHVSFTVLHLSHSLVFYSHMRLICSSVSLQPVCLSQDLSGGMVVSDVQVISDKEIIPHGYCYIPEYLEHSKSNLTDL